jgi:hypothetical protein
VGAGQKSLDRFPSFYFFGLANVYRHSHYFLAMKTTPEHDVAQSREEILDRISSIATMQPGTLTEEYRDGALGKDGKRTRLGPYFKLQLWRDGANRTSRVPASQAQQWREDIGNYHEFNDLCEQLAELNIEHTRALRTAQTSAANPGEGKKNSTPKQARKDTPKPKPSSRKPKQP